MDQRTPPPTMEDLSAVFERERKSRPHWPAVFADAMRDPQIVMILKLHARAGAVKVRQGPKPPRQLDLEAVDDSEHQREAMRPAMPHPDPAAHGYHGRRPTGLDFKSRAAGERED